MTESVLPVDASPLRKVLVGVGDVESAFFLQAVPCISSYHHPDLPALSVLIQYLTQCEGPMWGQIRGLGLSYHYRFGDF
jgi:Zn-dependent M16 (insulinase) family peptidase